MQSELHERLEYLVNYSSQLIFISGDSIAEQQKTLEAFVFQQHDDTEIAYLTADADMDISDYRRQLCRQLLGQVVGSFVRPLNELLSSLNDFDGPILIAITQAQHIPDKLLQELWDLVLQSRFAGNKQHLNVLLFAQTQWAEKAKQWLPAKNTQTPLLISSQSISLEKPASELDQMMAERRAAFQAHLDKRKIPLAAATKNPLSSPWLYIALGIVFLLTFGGLVAWQYDGAISSLFEPIETTSSPKAPMAAPGSAYDKLAPLANDELDEVNPQASETTDGSPSQPASPLITDWQQALGNLNAQTKSSTTEIKGDEQVTSDTQENPASAASAPKTPKVTSFEEPSDIVAGDNDNSATHSAQYPSIAQWLKPEHYVVQMMGMADKAAIENFIDAHQLTDITHVYTTQRYGGNWYVMIFNRPLNSLAEARESMRNLPDYPTKSDAFIKGGAQVLEEVAKSTQGSNTP